MTAGVLLAAGRGRRFGGAKLLALLDGEPLVRHAAIRMVEARLAPILVVVGAGDEGARVRHALEGLAVAFVENSDADAGMATSIARGVAALPSDCRAVVIALGDQPRVDVRVVEALVAASDGARGRIVVPVYRGVRANPVLFGREFFEELTALTGDGGARLVVERHPEAVRDVAVDAEVPRDVDTPADLDALGRGG